MTRNETSPPPNLNKIRDFPVTLYIDWVHRLVEVFGKIPTYEPFETISKTQTSILFFSGCLPSVRAQDPQSNQASPTHFWHDISDYNTNIEQVIEEQITAAFEKVIRVFQLNQSASEFKKILEAAKKKNMPSKRFLLEYYAYGTPPVTETGDLHFCSNRGNETINIKEVLNLAGPTTCFIFDCDKSGSLKPFIEEYAQQNQTDTFAFFSDSDGECIPRSSGLPTDLFTSCLTTPARMALLWHSRHYFCFKNGPLTPLNTSFQEETECDFTKIYQNINTLLRHIVEAMAFKVMDHDTFNKLFRKDRVVAQIAINFVLAQRIFSFFEKKPTSYPEIPDMTKNSLWNSFDMRMDAELFSVPKLTNSQNVPESKMFMNLQIPFHVYLRHVLTTLDNAVVVSKPEINYFPEISFMPSMLSEKLLQKDACYTLAKFLDRSPECIKTSLHFSVIPKLIQILAEGEILASVFCMIKIFNYEPSMWRHFTSAGEKAKGPTLPIDPIIGWIKKEEIPTLPFILATLLAKDHEVGTKMFAEKDYLPLILPFFKHRHNDVRTWSMFFVSCFAKYLSDDKINQIFEAAKIAEDEHDLEIKLANLYLCTQLSNGKATQEQMKILEYICSYIDSPFHVIRSQVLSSISIFYSNMLKQNESIPREYEVIFAKKLKELFMDQHSEISSIAGTTLEKMASHVDAARQSTVFQSFCYRLFDRIYKILENPELRINGPTEKIIKEPLNIEIKPHKKFKSFTPGSVLSHSIDITSNMIYDYTTDCICFADENGDFHIKGFKDSKIKSTRTLSKFRIDHIELIKNNDHPILFSSDSKGVIHGYNILNMSNTTNLGLVSVFEAEPSEDTQLRKYFSANDLFGFMLTYTQNSNNQVKIFDLHEERLVRTITTQKPVQYASWTDPMSNTQLGIICDSNFSIYDMRSMEQIYDLKLKEPGFQYLTIDCPSMKFALASQCGRIFNINFNATDTIAKVLSSPGTTTSSFAMQYSSRRYLLGHEKGITLFDNQNNTNLTLSKFSKILGSTTVINNVTNCLYHPVENAINIVTNKNILYIKGYDSD